MASRNNLSLVFATFALLVGAACSIDAIVPPRPGSAKVVQASGPTATGPRPRPNRIVLGYSYTGNDGKVPPEAYDFGELTHITRAFLPVKEDGSTNDGGIFDPKLTELARKNGVKLLASVGGWMGEHGDEPWLKMARDPKAKERFFDALDKIITKNGYDGVDIDWEPLVRDDKKEAEQVADQKTFTEFIVSLRQRFPKWLLTAAIQPGPNVIKHVNWKEIGASLDLLHLMTYDLAGPWTKHAAHDANLYATTDFVNKDDLDVNTLVSLVLAKQAFPPQKLLLGLPFYGRHYSTDKMGQPFPKGARHTGETINYSEVAPLIASGDYHKLWDNGAHIPYLERIAGGHTVSYDDEKAITEKCNYARDKGLGGVFIWALGTDQYAGRAVLLDTIAQAYGVPPAEPSVERLQKYYEARIGDAQNLSKEIVQAETELVRLDKSKPHKPYDPLREFVGLGTTKSEKKALQAQIERSEKLIYKLRSKLNEVDVELDALPLSLRAGKLVKAEGSTFLVADFEDGGIGHKLGGNWEAEADQNKLGTTYNPMPLKLTPGGFKGSKSCLRFYGHFGRPKGGLWPFADVGAAFPASDFSQWRAIRFAVKGNGKKYLVMLRRPGIRDYGNFRAPFTAPKEWTQVEVKLDDFAQPDWAHPVPKGWVDVTSITFMPDALFSDEDYDFSIDNLELVK